jgi:adenylate cyclase class 2
VPAALVNLPMIWEVEQKFPLLNPADLRRRLSELGVALEPAERQVDEYFNHPARDFRQTDEAFRLRCCEAATFVTYKGPKVDRATKTRQEIELPLPPGETVVARFQALLIALGFRPAGTVSKTREAGVLLWDGKTVQIALDDVEQLGEFLELEIAADQAGVAKAQAALHALSERLGLTNSERRSYLELLQEKEIRESTRGGSTGPMD